MFCLRKLEPVISGRLATSVPVNYEGNYCISINGYFQTVAQ